MWFLSSLLRYIRSVVYVRSFGLSFRRHSLQLFAQIWHPGWHTFKFYHYKIFCCFHNFWCASINTNKKINKQTKCKQPPTTTTMTMTKMYTADIKKYQLKFSHLPMKQQLEFSVLGFIGKHLYLCTMQTIL